MFKQVCKRINIALRRSRVRFTPGIIQPNIYHRTGSSQVQQVCDKGTVLSMQPVTLASAQSRDILVALGLGLEVIAEDDEESR
jgi:hypothetical protein